MTDGIDNHSESLESLSNAASEIVTGIPTPIKKSFLKAFSQLCTAAVDIPVAYLEGKAIETRAESEARVALIKASEEKIAQQMKVSPAYAQAAVEKFSRKIIRQKINLDEIVKVALDDIKQHEESENLFDDPSKPVISDDWLNTFEQEAAQKSSAEMKLLFGKILSGEIRNPSSFSIRSLKLLGQLDSQVASLFQRLCSLSTTLKIGNSIIDSRVISFNGKASYNSLQQYELGYSSLNILEEYGLISSDYNSSISYLSLIRGSDQHSSSVLIYGDKSYVLEASNKGRFYELGVPGVALTKAGIDLLSIVDKTVDDKYTDDLMRYFNNKQLSLIQVST